MAIPLDEHLTSAVRAGETDRCRSKKKTRKKRSRNMLLCCVALVGGLSLAGGVTWLVDTIRRENAAQAARDNFRRVAQAFLDHAEQNGQFMPAQAIYDKKTGKPLLSWRVALLPQLGEEALYKQIRLDEPWDSPHNRQFWGKMPMTYELPGLPASRGLTAIQVFTGPNTPFDGRKGPKFPSSFPDGTADTILIVEAAVAVNWMQPEDLDRKYLDQEDIRASLGNRTGKGPLVSAADGHTGHLPMPGSNDRLKAAITPAASDIEP
jgi:hypothetical protein